MAASVTDKLIKQGNGTQPIPTQLTAEKAVGATTASLAAPTGWDTTTAKHVRMYKTTVTNGQTIPNQSTLSFYKCTLSGTTLSDLTLIWSATGTDQKYDAGDTVDLAYTAGWGDDIYSALAAHLDQDGTLKAGAVDVAAVLASKVVTEDKIADDFMHGSDGWIDSTQTWTYASATTFTVSGNVAAQFPVGTKIKLTQTTAKYFYVVGASYSSPNTTITLTGGSDYTLANAAITSPAFSYMQNPQGFPQWFSYSPTLSGWSASPTNAVYRFSISGREATLVVRQGTATASNATTTTISLPITAATVSNGFWGATAWDCTDNSVTLSTAARAYIQSAGTTVSLANALNTAVMNASGNKAMSFTIKYEI